MLNRSFLFGTSESNKAKVMTADEKIPVDLIWVQVESDL